MGATLGLAALAAFLGVAVQAVTLPCESMGGGSSDFNPNVKCEMRPTDCYPGFTKVCPQKITGCEDGEDEFCRKDARAAVKAMLGLTASGRSILEPMDRARGKVTQEMKCGKGIPKFSCTFIFDYDPYGEVTSFRATKCNHRKKIEKCQAIVETSSGCTIRVLLSNKGSKMETVGNWKLECPATTPNPTATTVVTTTPTTTTAGPYSHAGDNVTVIGDGCACVPDFFIGLSRAPLMRAKNPGGKPSKPGKPGKPGGGKPFERPEGENWVRNRIPMEIRCKGVPKFNCTFLFDTDEYCDQVINMKATQCNHRKDVDKCPITLNTKLGCELKTTITNKGAKILVSPKIEISGGATRPAGFMDSCVCIRNETASARMY